MNRKVVVGLLLLAVLALAAGYWWGREVSRRDHTAASSASAGAAVSSRDGAATPDKSRRILYYRNPMGLNDISPVPTKDSMGMDYVPVYEGEAPEGPQVKISINRLQKLGVRSEAAATRSISRTLRAVGTVQASERGLYTVSPKFEGWITKLFVDTTGATVKRGQPLLEVYSPELVSAQEEYLVARGTLQSLKDASPEARASMQDLVDSSLQRLRNWDISDADLAELKAGRPAKHALTLRSRADGVVIAKTALDGMRFMPGETLFQIADLSSVWIVAEVFEQDLGLVRPGQTARITMTAYPGRTFTGKVTFVYPTVRPATRTGSVRIELPNTGGLLKPDLYGTVEIDAGQTVAAVAIPESAVLDSGKRQVVLVDHGSGVFEPREVSLGLRGDGYVEVLSGLAKGEAVVVNGNFLIDAESNLESALGSFGEHDHSGMAPGREPNAPGAVSDMPGPPAAPAAPPAAEHAGH